MAYIELRPLVNEEGEKVYLDARAYTDEEAAEEWQEELEAHVGMDQETKVVLVRRVDWGQVEVDAFNNVIHDYYEMISRVMENCQVNRRRKGYPARARRKGPSAYPVDKKEMKGA